jgi:hypothetical protein
MEDEQPKSPVVKARLRKTRSPGTQPKFPTLRKNFMEEFIKDGFLLNTIEEGNFKDAFEFLLEFKKKYKFEDKTFLEVLNYGSTSNNKNKRTADAIDKFIISSNDGEFITNANKLGSVLGSKKSDISISEGQGFKDLKKEVVKEEVKEKVEEEEEKEETKPSVLEASKEPKKEKKSKVDEELELAGVGVLPSKQPSATTGKTKAFTDKEVQDMMEELGVSKKEAIEQLKLAKKEVQEMMEELGVSEKEAIEQLKLAKKMESPTFSPDEMPTAKESMTQEKKAQEEAKSQRPMSGMTTKQEEDLLGISQENVKMEVKQPKRETGPVDIDVLPSKSDFIPPMRLGTRGKDIKDLLSDINYFFKNFKSQLKREQEFFKNVDKSNIDQLRELHNRIVGKLGAKKKEEGKKIGIIVNADEYIREQMKKILQEQTFASLRPQDVVIDVGSREAEGRERDTKDFGDFAVKRSVDGGLAATREAVYRYMPSENDPEIGEEGKSEKQRKKANRLSLPKARLNNQRTTAMRMNINNPFRVPQKTIKLKYLY